MTREQFTHLKAGDLIHLPSYYVRIAIATRLAGETKQIELDDGRTIHITDPDVEKLELIASAT